MLLDRGSGRNEAGMRASPAPRSSAKIPGAPCPVRGVCWRSSKCQTGEAIHKAMSTATRPPNQSQRNFSTSIALVPKWRYVVPRSFLKAKVLPTLSKDPSLPYIVTARQLDFRLCPSCLAVSSSWAPDKRLWMPGDGPASKVPGAVGKLSSPSCFLDCLMSP